MVDLKAPKIPFEINWPLEKRNMHLASLQIWLQLSWALDCTDKYLFFSFYFKQEICSHTYTPLQIIFSLWRPLLTFIFQRPLIPVWAHILNNEIFNNKMQLHMNFILFLYFSIQIDFDKCTTFITKISGKYSRVWNRRRAENNHRVWKIYQKE